MEGVINLIDVSSYIVGNNRDLIDLLPSEDDFNKYIEFVEQFISMFNNYIVG